MTDEGLLKKRIAEWWESDYSEELTITILRCGFDEQTIKRALAPFMVVDEAKKDFPNRERYYYDNKEKTAVIFHWDAWLVAVEQWKKEWFGDSS